MFVVITQKIDDMKLEKNYYLSVVDRILIFVFVSATNMKRT